MQGTVIFRARLPLEPNPDLPTNESHMFMGDGQMSCYYPINDRHCVWTVGFPEAALTAADAPPKPAKISTDAFAKPSTVSSKAPAKSANDAAGGTADSLTQQQAEAGNITVQVGLSNHKSAILLATTSLTLLMGWLAVPQIQDVAAHHPTQSPVYLAASGATADSSFCADLTAG